jgi:hypothetical protein
LLWNVSVAVYLMTPSWAVAEDIDGEAELAHVREVLERYTLLWEMGDADAQKGLAAKHEQIIAAVRGKFSKFSPNEKIRLLRIASLLGKDEMESPAVALKPRRIPWQWHITDRLVVEILVDALSDKDIRVRNEAGHIIVYHVPTSALNAFSFRVIAAVRALHISDDIGLLGKTGSAYALEVFAARPEFARGNPQGVLAARAGLGDPDAEKHLVKRFLEAKSPDRKVQLARLLGRVGTPAAVAALASELRSPMVYRKGGMELSVRVPIIRALSMAMPQHRVLWRPDPPPGSDDYYIEIEKWCQQTLHVSWDKRRPAFFYSMPIPRPLSGHLLRQWPLQAIPASEDGLFRGHLPSIEGQAARRAVEE